MGSSISPPLALEVYLSAECICCALNSHEICFSWTRRERQSTESMSTWGRGARGRKVSFRVELTPPGPSQRSSSLSCPLAGTASPSSSFEGLAPRVQLVLEGDPRSGLADHLRVIFALALHPPLPSSPSARVSFHRRPLPSQPRRRTMLVTIRPRCLARSLGLEPASVAAGRRKFVQSRTVSSTPPPCARPSLQAGSAPSGVPHVG